MLFRSPQVHLHRGLCAPRPLAPAVACRALCRSALFQPMRDLFNRADLFSSLCVVALAIERAGTVETASVQRELLADGFLEVGGNISFDPVTGQNTMQQIAMQFRSERRLATVWPRAVASDPLYFPMPTWEQRQCLQTFDASGLECNGHGSCGEDGTCECNKGRKGTYCSELDNVTLWAALWTVLGLLLLVGVIASSCGIRKLIRRGGPWRSRMHSIWPCLRVTCSPSGHSACHVLPI